MRPHHAHDASGRRLREAQLLLDEPRLSDLLTGPGPWGGDLPLADSSTRGDATSRITLEPDPGSSGALRLHILPGRPASSAELDEQVRTVVGLLAFARLSGRPAVTYHARTTDHGAESSAGGWVTRRLPGTRWMSEGAAEADGGPPLVSTAEVSFGDLLTAWHAVRTRHDTALSMLLAGVGLPGEFREAGMLALLGGAEALFATTTQLRRREIKDSTLRRKLEHLAGKVRLDEIMAPEIPAAVWAERAARLRSTFTHSGRLDPGSSGELRLLAQVTTGLVVLVLLRELGVPAGDDRRRLASLSVLRDAVRSSPVDTAAPSGRPPASAPSGPVGGLAEGSRSQRQDEHPRPQRRVS